MNPQIQHHEIDGGFLLTVNGLESEKEDVRLAFATALQLIGDKGKSFTLTPRIEVPYAGRLGSRTVIGEKATFWQIRTRGRYITESLTTDVTGSSVAPS